MTPDDVTNINIIGLGLTIMMSLLIFFLPRRYASIPLFIIACYMTIGQQVNVESLSITMVRVIVLSGLVRVAVRRELFSFRLNMLDRLVLFYVLSAVIINTASRQTVTDFINRIGFAYNALGGYFLFRSLLRDIDDLKLATRFLVFVSVPLAIAMVVEKMTGNNVFAIFGGVPATSELRGATVRCQGPFRHPITAGTFGATQIAPYIALWVQPRARKYALVGVLAASVIMLTPSSSGPLMTYILSLAGLAAWRFHKRLKVVIWGGLLAMVFVHLFMSAPIWFIIPRLSRIVGGTGYHRAQLIDQAIKHFSEWWLGGTNFTAHWMPITLENNPNMVDITNFYLSQGLQGGIVQLGLFVAVLTCAFRYIGLPRRGGQGVGSASARGVDDLFVWSLGIALFGHAISFMSVSYFDQLIFFFYLILAMISAVGEARAQEK